MAGGTKTSTLGAKQVVSGKVIFEAPQSRDMRLKASLVISQALWACDMSGFSEASFGTMGESAGLGRHFDASFLLWLSQDSSALYQVALLCEDGPDEEAGSKRGCSRLLEREESPALVLGPRGCGVRGLKPICSPDPAQESTAFASGRRWLLNGPGPHLTGF